MLERVFESGPAPDLREAGLTVALKVGVAVPYRDVVVWTDTVGPLVEDICSLS